MSYSLVQEIRKFFSEILKETYPEVAGIVEVSRSTQDQFGHYQMNSAMKLSRELKKPPRVIAEELAQRAVAKQNPLIDRMEIAGPGFINIWLKNEAIEQRLNICMNDVSFLCRTAIPQRVVIDFSSPNVAKEMHVGHLRSTIIGDCLARIFEFLGHDVVRLNHIGDWGTSFGMLIQYMKEQCVGELAHVEGIHLSDLVRYYKLSKALFDADVEFKKRAQQQVVALQGGDVEALRLWKIICNISRKAYQEIYDLLDIKLIERGESFYNSMLPTIVADLEKKGLVEVSEGAKCIFLEGFLNKEGEQLPLMVQKSDGGYNYDTTDLAAIYQRIFEEKANRILYVTDAGQATHFAMIFAAAIKAGYLDLSKVRVDHVPFGLVLGNDGKKFRTRSGETERLMDLLEEAIDRAMNIMKERHPDWSEQEQAEAAHALGLGAVKYADLSNNRMSDYVFNYDKMLKFEGNTIAFVMYSYVRALSIQKKVNKAHGIGSYKITHEAERALALHLLRFHEVLDTLVEDLLPNRLTDYLYELAEKFNLFFRDCRVEGAVEEAERLLLTKTAQRIFEIGFSLLGVRPLSRM